MTTKNKPGAGETAPRGTSGGDNQKAKAREITDKHERRSFDVRAIEIRESDGDTPARIEGLAVPYDVWTDIGYFREKIARGAFTKYINGGGDVVYNYGHQRHAVMGRRKSGTLRVEDRADGVYVSLDIPDTTLGRDMREMVGRGDIEGHSIEFVTVADSWRYDDDDKEERIVTEGELPGVALVADPAYADTTAALRSLEAWRDAAGGDGQPDDQADDQPDDQDGDRPDAQDGDAGDEQTDGADDGADGARMARLRLAEARMRMD